MKNKKLPTVEIKKSNVSGLGLFAKENIGWGERIIEYTGEVIDLKESDKREKFYERIGVSYLFELDNKTAIDGLVGGNESRFINHSSKDFNCFPIRLDGKIFFYAYKDIEIGEELLFDYGEEFTFKEVK